MTIRKAAKLLGSFFLFALIFTQADAQVLKEGKWVGKGYRVQGGFTIEQTDEGVKIILDEQFRTNNGPDLKIFLSKYNANRIHDRNAANGRRVAVLKSNVGKQEYILDSRINLSQYKSIVIHCERFSKLWGVADLES